MKYPKRFVAILKLIVSVLLIYWVVKNREFSLDNIKLGLLNIRLALVFLFLTFLQLFLASIRTHLLLTFTRINMFFLRSNLSISWASSFVGCVSPITLLSDIYKINELINLNPDQPKDNTFYASFFSKLFSLYGLIVISYSVSFFIKEPPQHINIYQYVLSGIIILSLLFFLVRKKLVDIVQFILEKTRNINGNTFLQRRLSNLEGYHKDLFLKKTIFFSSFAISLFIQLLNILSFLLIIYALNPQETVNVFEMVCVVPVGILAMTLPISFMGLGVGHVAFSELLNLFGIVNGSDVFTIFFAYSYLFNLLGSLFFLKILTGNR